MKYIGIILILTKVLIAQQNNEITVIDTSSTPPSQQTLTQDSSLPTDSSLATENSLSQDSLLTAAENKTPEKTVNILDEFEIFGSGDQSSIFILGFDNQEMDENIKESIMMRSFSTDLFFMQNIDREEFEEHRKLTSELYKDMLFRGETSETDK